MTPYVAAYMHARERAAEERRCMVILRAERFGTDNAGDVEFYVWTLDAIEKIEGKGGPLASMERVLTVPPPEEPNA